MKQLTIGNVTLDNCYVLGPMAGVTDLPFRLLCREQGAGLLCMEMISAKGILYNNKNTESLLQIHPDEMPVSLQLFGSDPKIVSEMAKRIEERPFSILDINMGCPVPKIVRNGEGSALMKNPKLVYELVSATVKAIQKPVTVKIRKGFDDEHVNAVEIAKIIEEAGASAVAVHGRTRSQMYTGSSNNEYIKMVKESVSIPVIGNGDIKTPQDALDMMAYTKCDAVMIGRALIGRPFLIKEIKNVLEGKENCEVSFVERLDLCKEYARRLCEDETEYTGIREIRGIAPMYLTGMPHASHYKHALTQVTSLKDFNVIIEEYKLKVTK